MGSFCFQSAAVAKVRIQKSLSLLQAMPFVAPTAIHSPLIRVTPLQASIEVVEVSRYLGGRGEIGQILVGDWASRFKLHVQVRNKNLTVKVMILARDDEGDGIIWDWACSTTFSLLGKDRTNCTHLRAQVLLQEMELRCRILVLYPPVCCRLLARFVLRIPGGRQVAFPKLGLLRQVRGRRFKSPESVKVSLWAVSVA